MKDKAYMCKLNGKTEQYEEHFIRKWNMSKS